MNKPKWQRTVAPPPRLRLKQLVTTLLVVVIAPNALATHEPAPADCLDPALGSQPQPHEAKYCRQTLNSTTQALDQHHDNWSPTTTTSCSDDATANKAGEPFRPYKDVWMMKYFDEQKLGFEVLVHEQSIDERLANAIYTMTSFKIASTDSSLFNTGDPKLDLHYEQLASGSKIDDQLCGQHLSRMLALIDELNSLVEQKRQNSTAASLEERHFRLAHVLDSFGHYDSGAFAGRAHYLGSPSQCSGTRIILNAGGADGGSGQEEEAMVVATRYCTARLSLDRHLNARLRTRRRASIEEEPVFQVGVCVPETCHSKSFQKHRELFQRIFDSQFKLPKSMFLDENLRVATLFCDPDDDSPLNKIPFDGKLLLALLTGWLSLALYATFKPATTTTTTTTTGGSASWFSRVYESLNLDKSWSDFMLTNDKGPARPSSVQLDTLNPVKCVGAVFVIFGHGLMIKLARNHDNLKVYNSLNDESWVFMTGTGTVVTDTFFVITGLMLSFTETGRFYSRQRAQQQQQQHDQNGNGAAATTTKTKTKNDDDRGAVVQFFKDCFRFGANRYLRLMPLYFLFYWFRRSVWMNYISGSLWDRGYNKETIHGSCKQTESWLTPLLLGAPYLPLTQQCMAQAWSVADDIAMCIMVAPIVFLLFKRPKLAISLAALFSLVSTWVMYNKLSNEDPDILNIIKDVNVHSISFIRSISTFYTIPYNRLYSVLIGVVAGYALQQYKQANDKSSSGGSNDDSGGGGGSRIQSQWPQWFRGPATKASIIIILTTLGIPASVPPLKSNLLAIVPIHHWVYLHMMTTSRLFWCMANAVLFLRMTTDWKDGYWMRKFSSKFWKVVTRLNLAILLIHVDVLIYDQHDPILYFSRYRLLVSTCTSYLICCLIGTFMYVTLENPIDKVIRLSLFERAGQRRPLRRELAKAKVNVAVAKDKMKAIEEKENTCL